MSEERAALKALLVLKSHTNTLILILPYERLAYSLKRETSLIVLLLSVFFFFVFFPSYSIGEKSGRVWRLRSSR